MSAKTNTDAVRQILSGIAEEAHEHARDVCPTDNFAMVKFKLGVQWTLEEVEKNLRYLDSLWDLFASDTEEEAELQLPL